MFTVKDHGLQKIGLLVDDQEQDVKQFSRGHISGFGEIHPPDHQNYAAIQKYGGDEETTENRNNYLNMGQLPCEAWWLVQIYNLEKGQLSNSKINPREHGRYELGALNLSSTSRQT